MHYTDWLLIIKFSSNGTHTVVSFISQQCNKALSVSHIFCLAVRMSEDDFAAQTSRRFWSPSVFPMDHHLKNNSPSIYG